MLPSLSAGAQPHNMPNITETYGGYDCKFIKPPPRIHQAKCPECHLILRDPYESACCGYNFCYTCSQQVLRNNSPCPWCRNRKFEVKENGILKSYFNQLPVFCTYKIDGCTWRGKLESLQAHLNATDHSRESSSMNVHRLGTQSRLFQDC